MSHGDHGAPTACANNQMSREIWAPSQIYSAWVLEPGVLHLDTHLWNSHSMASKMHVSKRPWHCICNLKGIKAFHKRSVTNTRACRRTQGYTPGGDPRWVSPHHTSSTGEKGLEPLTFGFGDHYSTIETILLVAPLWHSWFLRDRCTATWR
jgi:hypothetical protein